MYNPCFKVVLSVVSVTVLHHSNLYVLCAAFWRSKTNDDDDDDEEDDDGNNCWASAE